MLGYENAQKEKEVADKKLIQKLLSKGFIDEEIAEMMEIDISMVLQLKSSLG